jgi:hypothetical protein
MIRRQAPSCRHAAKAVGAPSPMATAVGHDLGPDNDGWPGGGAIWLIARE